MDFAALVTPFVSPLPAGRQKEQVREAENRLRLRLPQALADWHTQLGDSTFFLQALHTILSLEDLFIEDDRLVFAVEAQAVVKWGVKIADCAEAPDPTAYQEAEGSWYSEEVSLPQFLSILTYYQVLGGLPLTFICSGKAMALPAITEDERWREVVNHSGMRMWQCGSVIVCSMEGADDLTAAASSMEAATGILPLGFKPL